MKDMKKIIVASDSFKGSLTSIEVANAVEIGIKNVFHSVMLSKQM